MNDSFITQPAMACADNDTSSSSSSAVAAAVTTDTATTLSQDFSIPTSRHVSAVWFTMPIAVVGIVGNILSFIVLGRRQRRVSQAHASSATIGIKRYVVRLTGIICRSFTDLSYPVPTAS